MKKRDYSGSFQCVCGKEYTNSQAFKGHQSQCKVYLESKGVDVIEYFINRTSKNSSKQKQLASIKKQIRLDDQKIDLDTWIEEQHHCEKCDKVMTEKYGSGRFCSRQCANSHVRSEESKQKISNSMLSSVKVSKRILTTKNKKEQAVQEYNASPNCCTICNEPLTYEMRSRQTCSIECNKILLSKKAKIRIAETGVRNLVDPRFKYGTYNGFHCDSSWELAFVIYCCDHSIPIIRCSEKFTYFDTLGEQHSYFPDFMIDGCYYEIKGWKSSETELKIKQFPADKHLIVLYSDGIEMYLDYVLSVYGKDFTRLYDRNFPSWMDKESI